MRTHEPLELLKLLHVVLDDVGADHVQLVQLGDGLAVIGDERVVILDQGLKVLLGAGATVDVERLPGAVAGDGIGAAVRRAAQRGDAEELVLLKQLAEDIDELDAQLQGKKTTPEVIQAITAKDIAFHTFLCRMSKNPVFERMLPVIIKSVRASYSLLVPRLSNGPRVSIHGEIYKAVAAHDGDEAYRLMVAHLSKQSSGL